MMPFIVSDHSDFVVIDFHVISGNSNYALLHVVTQVCNLSYEFLDKLLEMSGADYYDIEIINFSIYINK
jgi:hypothetical protein